MAKIPLRVYNREIENLIDRGQTEEALAHCKHILQTYPKYIEAYRLLGKTYLETQLYLEASDILARVLSSVPDDFVAHVGLSIVREDEGKLDGAIWHMERAYEIQPSNAAVQDELRRLYSRRDGAEPPRVRLTKGGLIRMHARGDLTQQATAELTAFLQDAPDRPDMQVLLARLYHQSGKRVEAAEVCSDLISSFPYCLDACRILSEILPGTSRAEEASVYLQRVIALDPYMAFVNQENSSVDDVPDNAVMIDRLEWNSANALPSLPSQVSPLGISLEGKESHTQMLPDWLASLSPIPAQPSPLETKPPFNESQTGSNNSKSESAISALEDLPIPAELLAMDIEPDDGNQPKEGVEKEVIQDGANKPVESADIPSWMKEAGWDLSDSAETDAPVPLFFEEREDGTLAVENDALPADEIPEWLQPLAPIEPAEDSTAENLPWLEEILSQTSPSPNESTPSMVTDGEEQPELEINQQPVREVTAPEEMLPIEQDQEPATQITPEAIPGEEPLPAWMADLKQTPEESASSQPVVPAFPTDEDLNETAWPAESLIEPAENENLEILEGEQPSTTAWLEDIVNKHGSEAETIISRPSDRIARPPKWVQDSASDQPFSISEPEGEIPDWLTGLEAPVDEREASNEEPSYEPAGGWFGATPLESVNENVVDETQSASIHSNWSPETQVPSDQKQGEVLSPIETGIAERGLPQWLIVLSNEPIPSQAQIYADLYAGLDEEIVESEVEATPVLSTTRLPGDQTAETSPLAEDSDWLKSLQEPTETSTQGDTELKQEPEQAEAVDSWFTALVDEAKEPGGETAAEVSEEVGSAWIEGGSSSKEETTFETAEVVGKSDEVEVEGIETEGEAPEWLSDLDSFISMSQAEQVTTEETGAPIIPETEISSSSPQDELAESEKEVSNAEVEEDVVEIPEEHSEAQGSEGQGSEAELVESSADIEEQSPIAKVEETQEVIDETSETTSAEESLPDWLSDLESFVPADTNVEPAKGHELLDELEMVTEETPIVEIRSAETEVMSEEEIEKPESLPAEAETFPIEEVSTQAETMPDWLQSLEMETPSSKAEGLSPVEAVTSEEVEAEWIQSMQEEKVSSDTLEQVDMELTPSSESISQEEIDQKEGTSAETFISKPAQPRTLAEQLEAAQAALNVGQVETALDGYLQLIKSGNYLEETTHDLRDALYHYPIDVSIWQTLGDAYLRMNQVQDALDAYTKAEELMR